MALLMTHGCIWRWEMGWGHCQSPFQPYHAQSLAEIMFVGYNNLVESSRGVASSMSCRWEMIIQSWKSSPPMGCFPTSTSLWQKHCKGLCRCSSVLSVLAQVSSLRVLWCCTTLTRSCCNWHSEGNTIPLLHKPLRFVLGMYFPFKIGAKQSASTQVLPQSNIPAQVPGWIGPSAWTGSIKLTVMNHHMEFQCHDLSSSWSPGAWGLWVLLRLLNTHSLQSRARAGSFGPFQGMFCQDIWQSCSQWQPPVQSAARHHPCWPALFCSGSGSDTFCRHVINLCKMNIAFVAQWHENFAFPPTAILEFQIDGGKKHQGRAQDALDEWHAIQPDIMAKSRQPGFQLTPHVMESHSLFY